MATSLLARVRLRTTVNRHALQAMERLGHPPLQQEGASDRDLRTTTQGVDPIRVLLFGGGLAVGYGAATRSGGLDLALAERITERTGRGCSVQNRARRHVALDETAQSLGAVGTRTYRAAVWCPTITDVTTRLSTRRWVTGLHGMIRELRSDHVVPLVMMEVPQPSGRHPVVVLARPWVLRLNGLIRAVASEHDEVVVVPPGPLLIGDPGTLDIPPDYYRRAARTAADAVVDLLRGVPAAAVPVAEPAPRA